MSQLVAAIATRLPAGTVQLDRRVNHIARGDNTWQVALDDGSSLTFDALIYALPAYTHTLLSQADETLGKLVSRIEHAGCSVVMLGYRKSQVKHPLTAFGFVVPAVERRRVIAGSLASVKFAGRAPDDRVLMRLFIGGALQPELARLPDDELLALARRELADLLGVSGEPDFGEVVRWLGVMPQYHVGHLDHVAQIESRAAELPRFGLAGNAYRGVGIPFCIRSGEQAAQHVAAQLGVPVVA
jgi:oxygen-dependent protoporphyrinogen oxidase